jgi:hypothetical protein
MLTRRRLLAGAGFTAGSALAAPNIDSRFAGLKSRRDEAKPITVDERRARIERAR